jgi:adenylyltransferase/sulfurtransferase
MNASDRLRFSRHLRIPGFDEAAQIRLARGRVLVVGLGGLGSPVSLYLAAAGVGTIGLMDDDRVEFHNLQRQILFGDASVGRNKTEVAAERLRQVNESLVIRTHHERLAAANAAGILESYDVVIDASDNFETRYALNDACHFARKPLVHGSVFRFEGQVTVFHHGADGPCYRCLFPNVPEPGTVPDCNESGVVGALCGVVGSLQAMEAIKILSGVGEVMSAWVTKVDVWNNRFPVFAFSKDPDCPLCGSHPVIHEGMPDVAHSGCGRTVEKGQLMQGKMEVPEEVSVLEAKADAGNWRWLDVREADEVALCRIEGSHWIPMAEVPERLGELDPSARWLVYCHHGMRSMRVTRYLRQAGLRHCSNLKGGIDAWARQVDPLMSRY